MKLRRDPLCERCMEHGITRLAKLVHHIVPVRTDRSKIHTMTNLRSLCVPCHPIEEVASQGARRV